MKNNIDRKLFRIFRLLEVLPKMTFAETINELMKTHMNSFGQSDTMLIPPSQLDDMLTTLDE